MQKNIRKYGLIILLILILPITAFFIYQFSSLSQSEKEINKIYIQQLETIIYSVNQYSQDVVNSWINEIGINLSRKNILDKNDFTEFFDNNFFVYNIFITGVSQIKVEKISKPQEENNSLSTDSILKILNNNKSIIDRLKNFSEKGYQKIEPVGKVSDNLYLCLFPLQVKDEFKIGGIIFNPQQFIQQTLASKISQAAGDEFVLTVINDENNLIIFSSEQTDVKEIILKKPLWLLPNLSLGIKMKSGSINDLLLQRFYTNVIVLAFLLIILIIGLFLILYNLRKELRLAQLKSDFIANVSHELRTPLALISMYSETLVLDRLKNEDKKKEYYSVIHSETNRLSKIVNSILNFSKMETQSRKYNFTSSNLCEISNEVFNTYDFHIKSKGFVYTLNCPEQIENVNIDKDAISESIINLIDNAMKYSNEKKEIIITIDSNNKGPYWEIKDFGIGINTQDQKKIFDKFYRVSSGLVDSTKGTGLGLSLVKQIMSAHDGYVSVESKIGNGSTFRLQFDKNFKKNN
jgi:two-component system, OmpR family, phosphate regulon sensor histidine kinase PhoR